MSFGVAMCKPELVLCAVMMRCQTTFSVLRLLPVSNETPNPGGKGKTGSIYLIYQEYDCFKRTSCVHVRSVLCAAPDFALPELAVVGPTYVPSCRFSCTPGACFNHSNCRFLNKRPPHCRHCTTLYSTVPKVSLNEPPPPPDCQFRNKRCRKSYKTVRALLF